MAKQSNIEGSVTIRPLNKMTSIVKIIGTSPLIVHRFSAKAIRMMEEKQQKATKTKKHDLRIPEEDFNGARHLNENGQDCFPSDGIKAAVVRAGQLCGIPMTQGRQLFTITSIDGENLAPIVSPPPIMRTDTVRIGMGVTDLRYRPEYRDWAIFLRVSFDADNITLEQVVNLINRAGSFVGIGEWRPLGKSSSGTYGCFEVAVE